MTTEERLGKLEQELARAKRRSRVTLVAAVMTMAGMVLLGAGNDAVQKVVRAEKFELVGSTGDIRARLGVDKKMGTALMLYDQNGNARAVLSATDPAAGLVLWDQDGVIRCALNLLEKTGASLTLSDQNGISRTSLTVDERGNPSLGMIDQVGNPRALLSTTEGGSPSLSLTDQNGKPRFGLLEKANGTTTLLLFDQNGTAIWHAP